MVHFQASSDATCPTSWPIRWAQMKGRSSFTRIYIQSLRREIGASFPNLLSSRAKYTNAHTFNLMLIVLAFTVVLLSAIFTGKHININSTKNCHLRAIVTTVATLAFKGTRYRDERRDGEEMNQVLLDSMRMLKRRLRCKGVSRSSDLMVHSNYSLITSIDKILQPINVSL